MSKQNQSPILLYSCGSFWSESYYVDTVFFSQKRKSYHKQWFIGNELITHRVTKKKHVVKEWLKALEKVQVKTKEY